jgi:hypothetical protein
VVIKALFPASLRQEKGDQKDIDPLEKQNPQVKADCLF